MTAELLVTFELTVSKVVSALVTFMAAESQVVANVLYILVKSARSVSVTKITSHNCWVSWLFYIPVLTTKTFLRNTG